MPKEHPFVLEGWPQLHGELLLGFPSRSLWLGHRDIVARALQEQFVVPVRQREDGKQLVGVVAPMSFTTGCLSDGDTVPESWKVHLR